MKKSIQKVAAPTNALIIAERLSKQATPLIMKASNISIRTQDDYQACARILANLKELGKLAKDEEEKFTKPIKELAKVTSGHFKPFYEKISQIEQLKKGEMVEFLDAQEEKSKKLQEKFDSGEIKKVSTLLGKQAELHTTSDDASVRRLKVVEITDEKKIPREYMVPNLAAIKAALLEGYNVPGAKIVEQKSIAI